MLQTKENNGHKVIKLCNNGDKHKTLYNGFQG